MPDDPRKSRKELPLVQFLPNLLTVAALCAGLTAIRFAILGHFAMAVALVLAAAVLDGLDGRLARLLHSESEIGAELDSLGDFVNFGVAPALVLYLWGMDTMQSGGWIAALIYVVCCLMRLARFNIGSRAAVEPTHFTGVPSPAGALLVMLPIYVAFIWPLVVCPAQALALYMVGIGALMISRLPTPSFKKTTVYAEHARFVFVGFVALVAALLTYPWITLMVMSLAYFGVILSSWWRMRSGGAD